MFFPRQRISKEEIPEVRSTIRELEAAWDRKWMDTLKDTPLVSFLNEDPVSGAKDFLNFACYSQCRLSAFFKGNKKC